MLVINLAAKASVKMQLLDYITLNKKIIVDEYI